MFTILGAGFGLYGYLPALFANGEERVLLPERYKKIIDLRPELFQFRDRISWAPSSEIALQTADGAIIARRPVEQPLAARKCMSSPSIRKIVLEKPLAPDPANATGLLQELISSGRQFRLPYLLLLTPMNDILQSAVNEGKSDCIEINWTFMAHHFANGLDNWKRSDAMGGGAIRFYGVHIIAALAQLGYNIVKNSIVLGSKQGESECWRAIFSHADAPDCAVTLDSRCAQSKFEIASRKTGVLLAEADPFSEKAENPSDQDRRISFLAKLLHSFERDDVPFYDLYARVNELWAEIEARSQFCYR